MEYYKYLRQYVGHQPIILPGSVVIMINEKKEVLLQKRRDGYWGLPGGLMDLGESFEEVAKREVFEETGLVVGNLKLLSVNSGADCYLKVANGDELYSATAIFYTEDIRGDLVINYEESEGMEYFPLNQLPEQLIDNDKRSIEYFLETVKF
ncbi:NUDIX hydrolase [Sporosarcina sp. OR05]|uniref:NUDIX hydrolase n=1 Tax=Sporosarcina sp. OR05 TaxID=2969819 RepID=UPI00352A2D93